MTAHNKHTPKRTKSKIILPKNHTPNYCLKKEKALKTSTEQIKSIQSFTIK